VKIRLAEKDAEAFVKGRYESAYSSGGIWIDCCNKRPYYLGVHWKDAAYSILAADKLARKNRSIKYDGRHYKKVGDRHPSIDRSVSRQDHGIRRLCDYAAEL
jgi:hypothetical protein